MPARAARPSQPPPQPPPLPPVSQPAIPLPSQPPRSTRLATPLPIDPGGAAELEPDLELDSIARTWPEQVAPLPTATLDEACAQALLVYEREIATELIREAALVYLQQEVPHALAVRLDEFTERGEAGAYIAATLFVERDSQKGIVIGDGGAMLKKIGSAARKEIETMSGRKVFLELRVKVAKDWRNDEAVLRRLGYKIKKR